MSELEVNVVNQARVGAVGNNTVHGDLKIDQSKTTISHNYGNQNEHNGKIPSFHFDLETLQREGIIASRDDELLSIQRALQLQTRNGSKVAILKGIGGAGKTTLAKMYANTETSRDPFDNLIWINAQNSKSVGKDFQELLKYYLNVGRRVAGKQLADAVYNSILKHKTLIVFDNVEKADDISNFLPTVPQPPYPQIIITTRNKLDMRGYEKHWVPVEVLSLKVSEVYIREKLEMSPLKIPDIEEKWEELAVYFGRLVIALRAATVSIVNENERREFWDEDERQVYTVEMYLNEIKQVKILEVNSSNPDDPAEETYRHLRQIWTKNLDQDLPGQHSERILQILALLAPSGVPDPWFRTLLAVFLDPQDRSSKQMLAQAKRSLVWRSLVEISDGSLVIHRLLQTTLLSRLKAKPEQRTLTIHWFLPAMAELYARLWKEQKLEKFHANLYSLLDNIRDDLLGNVSDTVVSFLVNMNLPGMKACERLTRQLIRNVFEARVCVNSDGLNLLLASFQLVDSVLLLPQWIREFRDEVPIQHQIKLINKCLSLKIPDWETGHRFDVYFSSSFYTAIALVLEKWQPQFKDHLQTTKNTDFVKIGLDVLNIIDYLCETLSLILDGKVKIHPYSSYSDLRRIIFPELVEMLDKLKKGLSVAMTLLFSQQNMFKTENLEAMFASVAVAVRWHSTAVEVESHWKKQRDNTNKNRFKPMDLEELDKILKITGVFKFTIRSYHIQLEKHYRQKSILQSLSQGTALEARVAACFAFILIKTMSFSDTQRNGFCGMKKANYVPLDMIPLLNSMTKLEWFWGKSVHKPIVKAHLLCLGLEPHLQELDAGNVEKPKHEQENLEFLSDIHSFIKTFQVFIGCSKNNWATTPTRDFFSTCGALHLSDSFKGWLFNWEKCAEIMDKLLERYNKTIKSSTAIVPLSIALCEGSSDPEKIVETLEKYCARDLSSKDKSEFRQELDEFLKAADATDTPRNCQCIFSRYQRLQAVLDFEDGKTEVAIAVALKAFNHQLYCAGSYGKIVETVQVLLDAYSTLDDAATRSTNLLERLITEHVGYTECEVYSSYQPGKQVKTSLISQSKLIRYLCSIGLTLQAADFGKTFLGPNVLADPASSKFVSKNVLPKELTFYDIEGILILALMLLLKGENDGARDILKSVCQKLWADSILQSENSDRRYGVNPEIQSIYRGRTRFAEALEKLSAWRSKKCVEGLESVIESFRSGVFLFRRADEDGYYKGRNWEEFRLYFEEFYQANERSKLWFWEKSDTTKLLSDDDLVLLWMDTMETIFFGDQNIMDETPFVLLERQMELRGVGMKFRWKDTTTEWGIKCFLGMYHRREFWTETSLEGTAAT